MSTQTKLLRVEGYKNTLCSFYALDPWAKQSPLVAAGIASTSLKTARKAVAALLAGERLEIVEVVAKKKDEEEGEGKGKKKKAPGIKLQCPRRLELEIPGEDAPRCYFLSYETTAVQMDAGAEACLVLRDATMAARYGHVGYLLAFPEDAKEDRLARFFHLWGSATGLPARQEWAPLLWSIGLKLGLVQALDAYGCEGWRIDPRRSRPEGKAGWDHVLQLLVTTYV